LRGEREGAEWVEGRGWGQEAELTQALYAHMNNKIIKKNNYKKYFLAVIIALVIFRMED
jgi:hypothetical protein